MNKNDFPRVMPLEGEEPPHRAISRAPARHNVTVVGLGLAVVAGVFAILWGLYTLG